MMKPLAFAALTAVLLATTPGCAPSTALGVRQLGSEKQYSFYAPENYQPVYRKILEQERNCFQPISNAFNGQFTVHGDLYHDIRSGTITTVQQAGYGINTWRVIDVKAVDEKNTKVTAYFGIGPADKGGQILKQWTLENSDSCDLKG